MAYRGFDDKWILENWKSYKRWCDMFRDYEKLHPDNHHSLTNFRTHCNCDLKLNRRYTSEQDAWIRETYPHHGAKETFRMFEERFGITKGFRGFQTHICDLGLHVTEERQKKADADNGHREKLPVGTVRYRSRNSEWIMTEDGWMPMQTAVMGKCPNGFNIVHLDRDQRNNSRDNLAFVSKTNCGLMTGHGLWSDHPEVNRTALMWCDLHEALRKEK